MKSIIVIGRTFFNKHKGHSIYSARILVDGEFVQRIQSDGYGNQFLYDAFAYLEKEGYLLDRKHYANDVVEAPFAYCDRKGIKLYYEIITVSAKKYL